MDEYWAVVCTVSRREQWAAENVERHGYRFYLPKFLVQKRAKGQQLLTAQVLFPRYLFVRITGQWRILLNTFGIVDMVMQGGQPARMPDKTIADLRMRQDSEGFIVLPQRPQLKFGQRVRLKQGPFAGHYGIYQGDGPGERRSVLLNLLNGKVKVLIGEASVEVA